MPRKTTTTTELSEKWNFYINQVDKAEYQVALVKSGKPRAQSAGLRAMIYLYVHDEDIRAKVNNIIDDFIVYKQNGKTSQM